MLAFIISSVIAGVAGLVYVVSFVIDVSTGIWLTTYGIIVSIVGVVRSIGNTILSGILLGIVHALTGYFLGTYFAMIILLLIILRVLMVSPRRC